MICINVIITYFYIQYIKHSLSKHVWIVIKHKKLHIMFIIKDEYLIWISTQGGFNLSNELTGSWDQILIKE